MEAHSMPIAVAAPHASAGQARLGSTALARIARHDAIGRRALAVADIVAASFTLLVCLSAVGHDRLRICRLVDQQYPNDRHIGGLQRA